MHSQIYVVFFNPFRVKESALLLQPIRNDSIKFFFLGIASKSSTT